MNINWSKQVNNIKKWLFSEKILPWLLLVFIAWGLGNLFDKLFFKNHEKEILENTTQSLENDSTIIENTEQSLELSNKIENQGVQIINRLDAIMADQIDHEEVEYYIENLDFSKSLKYPLQQIDTLEQLGKINRPTKNHMCELVESIFKHIDKATNESSRLKSIGQNFLANSLENISAHLLNKNSVKIQEEVNKAIKHLERPEKIILLKNAINASKLLYAFKETKAFYDQLIIIQATPQNYFEYGNFLLKLSSIEEANEKYLIALNLKQKSPTKYLDFDVLEICGVLHMLGIINYMINEPDQAFKYLIKSLDTLKSKPILSLSDSIVMANINLDLSLVCVDLKKYSQAEFYNRNAKELFEITKDSNIVNYPYKVAAIKINHSIILADSGQYDEALKETQTILSSFREIKKVNLTKFFTIDWKVRTNMAEMHFRKGNVTIAIKIMEGLIESQREQYQLTHGRNKSELSYSLIKYARYLKSENLNELAIKASKEALEINQLLLKSNKDFYQAPLIESSILLGDLYRATNKYREALSSYLLALEYVNSHTIIDEYERNQITLKLLEEIQVIFSALPEFTNAIYYGQKLLNLRINFSKIDTVNIERELAIDFYNLGMLYGKINLIDNAILNYRNSKTILRRLFLTTPEEADSILSTCYIGLARLYANNSYHDKSMQTLEEFKNLLRVIRLSDINHNDKRITNAYVAIAEFQNFEKDYCEAIITMKELININRRRVFFEPNRTLFGLAQNYSRLGDFYIKNEDYKNGIINYNLSAHFYEVLDDISTEAIVWKSSLNYYSMAEAYLMVNDKRRAIEAYLKAKSTFEYLLELNPKVYEESYIRLLLIGAEKYDQKNQSQGKYWN